VAAWEWRKTLAVAQAAAGHHGEFRSLDALAKVLSENEYVLEDQLETLDYTLLNRAVGTDLPTLPAANLGRTIGRAMNLIRDDFTDAIKDLPIDEAARYRLLVQLVFSMLLEADKAFLAVPEADRAAYLAPRRAVLAAARVTEFVGEKPAAAVNDVRAEARRQLDAGMAVAADARVLTLTLPTGTGKTLLAATWALVTRERLTRGNGVPPLVLVVLPFLTVIEQTANEYADLFPTAAGAGELTNYHSLSDRTYAPDLEPQPDPERKGTFQSESQDFFLDTWRSDVVVTTFDQFLFALQSPKARHQMRFHHLADAVVILDEVQAFPVALWEPLRLALAALTRLGSTRVLAMSATQPGFLPDARELVPDARAIFAGMKRYRIVFLHREKLGLSAFIAGCTDRLGGCVWKGKRVMLTLNTRRSARRVRDGLVEVAKCNGFAVEFLTADVTPLDRLAAVVPGGQHAVRRGGRRHRPRLRRPRLRTARQRHPGRRPVQPQRQARPRDR
jgi:CRISPR-associated endonuclease/helicase Cas3